MQKNRLLSMIGVGSGTFDPIHNGHLALAEQARQLAQVDRVLFIPCRQSPHKNNAPVADAEQRCSMIEHALTHLEWADLSRAEIDRNTESFSWQTAEYFAGQFPKAKIYWILGSDQWSKIDSWAEPDQLREQLTFIVATRNGDSIESRPGWNHLPLTFEHPASSTAIRSGNYDSNWLPDSVDRYIKSHPIYF